MSKDYHYLCCACGEISPFAVWTLWQRDEEGELVPNPPGESDPICRCPVCHWDHVDSDTNPGIYDGERAHLERERELNLPDFEEAWRDRRRWTTDVAVRLMISAGASRVMTVQNDFADSDMDETIGYELIHVGGDLRARVDLREDGSLVVRPMQP